MTGTFWLDQWTAVINDPHLSAASKKEALQRILRRFEFDHALFSLAFDGITPQMQETLVALKTAINSEQFDEANTLFEAARKEALV